MNVIPERDEPATPALPGGGPPRLPLQATAPSYLDLLSTVGAFGVLQFTFDGRVIEANDAFLALIGASRADLAAGLRWDDLVAPSSLAAVATSLGQLHAVGEARPVEIDLQRADGGSKVTVLVAAVMADRHGDVGTALVFDVSERQRARFAAEVSARQQTAVATLGREALRGATVDELLNRAMALCTDALGVPLAQIAEYLAASDEFVVRALAGWPAEFVGRAFAAAGCQAEFTLRSGRAMVSSDLVREQRFSTPQHVLARGAQCTLSVPIQAHDWRFGVLCLHDTAPDRFSPEDVDFVQAMANVLAEAIERQRTRAAHERLVAILEATSDYVAMADGGGRIVYRNPAAMRMLGIATMAPPGYDRAGDGLTVAEQGRVRDVILPALEHEGSWRGTSMVRGSGNRAIPVSVVAIGHRNAQGQLQYMSTVMRDISEQQKLEAQLRQAQKMEAVGQLTGGVAHDFNNHLAVILAGAAFLLADLPGGDPRREDAQEISDAARRAAALTRQLLAFARKQVLDPQALDLGEVVLGMERMLRRLLGEDIDLGFEVAPALGNVRADRGQIEQVILNLAINARDAMPEGGQLTIEVADCVLGAHAREHDADAQPGGYVRISVTDSGCGMDEATRQHLFEPFFTTKPVGHGTGLGLSTCFGIVRQSGGFIWVYSEPGLGSAFKVYLPRTAGSGVAAAPRAERSLRGAASVLLVEDEARVRAMVARILRQAGYQVLEAAGPEAALEIALAAAAPPDLLLTDVVMPGQSGPALWQHLAERWPGLRALFMSGYTDHAMLRTGRLPPGVPFVQKPFEPRDLLEKLHEVLQIA